MDDTGDGGTTGDGGSTADGGTAGDGGTTADGGTTGDGGGTTGDGGGTTGDGGTELDERQLRCEAATAATRAFYDSLDSDQAAMAVKGLFDEARSDWSNLPVAVAPRDGISFLDLSEDQILLARAMVDAGLSRQGQDQVEANFQVEQWWEDSGDDMLSPDFATVVLFGEPTTTGGWAWQLDAHHLAVNLTARCPDMIITPTLWGTNPEIIEDGPYAGAEPMGLEVDRAFAFLDTLSESQLEDAVIAAEAPRDLLAGAGNDDRIPEFPLGLPASALDGDQQALLLELLAAWIEDLSEPHAALQMVQVEADLDETWFAWAGDTFEGEAFYYRIQGPEFFIELDHFAGASHIHAVHRHPDDDYGAELLSMHYEAVPH